MATTVDAYDANPGNGVCQGVLGYPCSLRAAIQEANALAGADVITLPAGTYNLTRTGVGEDNASTGDLDINPNPNPIVNQDLTINGAGAGTTVIDAGYLDRVFHVLSRTVSISGVTMRNGDITLGSGNSFGGGFYNLGTLTLTNSTVSGNVGGSGGGIYNSGTLTLTNSTVSGNYVIDAGSGGGIFNTGTLALTNSTVSGNAGAGGGAIYNSNFLTLTDSTVSGNTASSSGGAIDNYHGTLALTNSTVSGNTGAGSGGAIHNHQGTLTLTNSTVSGNESTSGAGGGFYNSGTVTLTNSTVSGNEASEGGGFYNSGTVTATNSTVSGNTAYDGGGVRNSGTLTLTNSTFTNNTAGDAYVSGDGGGIASTAIGAAVYLKNTLVSGNFDLTSMAAEPDCVGALTSQGYNLIQTVSPGCTVTGDTTGNIVGQGADLGPLASNGGPTQTHAILAGSPAIDAGSPDCPPPATDQRGVGRPLGSGCDIGAYESSFGCADDDSDDICNSADNCPTTANATQTNNDADAFGDACDNCPVTTNPDQANQDNDLAGDACEPAHCVAVPNWWSSPSPALDPDCDGFMTTIESDPDIGTDPNDPCANTETVGDETDDKWPVDFTDNRIVNTLDLTGYASRMNTVPVTALDHRHDLNQNGVINTLDLTPYATMLGRSCA